MDLVIANRCHSNQRTKRQRVQTESFTILSRIFKFYIEELEEGARKIVDVNMHCLREE